MTRPLTLPRRFLGALTAATVIVAACASGATPSPVGPSAAPSGSAAASSSTPAVLPVPVTTEFRIGDNRTVFSLLDSSGQKPVAAPDRTLAIGYRGPNGETIAPAPQTFVWAIEGVNGVYVGRATFPSAGAWQADFTTEAPGSPAVTLTFSFDVAQKATVVSPGDPAPSVDTPTLADVGGDLARISTDSKPVKRFYETSVADALAAKKPFVLVFATPKFCQTATCGPTLDKVKPVAAAHPDMTFINVEPYELQLESGQLQPVLNGGQLVPAPATTAYRLRSEPFVFVVGADGRVSASFELVFAPDELESAVAAVEGAG
ncbi:MAG TPA: hypothetical protein VFK35_08030 [Candidatus Limnocylindrales bacterium]|nr:hypothetical protein [Candidatus Limnocylindrales bacterium]